MQILLQRRTNNKACFQTCSKRRSQISQKMYMAHGFFLVIGFAFQDFYGHQMPRLLPTFAPAPHPFSPLPHTLHPSLQKHFTSTSTSPTAPTPTIILHLPSLGSTSILVPKRCGSDPRRPFDRRSRPLYLPFSPLGAPISIV